MSETRRTVVPNVPNHTRIALVWGAERKASSQIERYSAGIKKLSELEIDCNKDWLKYGISRIGTLSIISPNGTVLGYICQDNTKGIVLTPDATSDQVTINSGKLMPQAGNTLEFGNISAGIKKIILGDSSSCRLKIPVGSNMYD